MSIGDKNQAKVKEEVVLSKFEGDPVPENEFERIYIVDGSIVAIEKLDKGVVVERVEYGGPGRR